MGIGPTFMLIFVVQLTYTPPEVDNDVVVTAAINININSVGEPLMKYLP